MPVRDKKMWLPAFCKGYFLQGAGPAHGWPCIPPVDTLPFVAELFCCPCDHEHSKQLIVLPFHIPSLQVFAHLVFLEQLHNAEGNHHHETRFSDLTSHLDQCFPNLF